MSSRKLVAEFVGTFMLVFFAVGVATLCFGFGVTGSSIAAGVVATALAFGLVLLGLVYTLGPLSGCQVNPAVTVGALLSGRMAVGEAAGYMAAQFAGGIAGSLALWGIFSGSPFYSRSRIGLGADGWGKLSMVHLNGPAAFGIEVVMSFVFVLVVLMATSRVAAPAVAGLVIGLSLTVVHLIGIPLTGTSVNPAQGPGSGAGGGRDGVESGVVVHRRSGDRWGAGRRDVPLSAAPPAAGHLRDRRGRRGCGRPDVVGRGCGAGAGRGRARRRRRRGRGGERATLADVGRPARRAGGEAQAKRMMLAMPTTRQ